MKFWSKLIALLTIIALVIALSACGKPGGDPTPTPGESEEPSPTEQTDREFDMGGKVIRVAAWWYGLPSEDSTSEAGQREYQRMKELEQKYKCTFEAIQVPANDISVQFDAAVLSDDIFAEIVFMRSENAASYATQGQLYPIDEIFDLSLPQFNPSITEKFTIDGKVYAFSTWGNSVESAIAFNKDIFERVGLAEPYELVKNKEWTWDKFVEYVNKATIRSGDNEPEVYGFYGVTTDPNISQVMASFGAEFVHRDSSGVYSSGLNDEKTLKALNFLYELNTTNPGVYVPEPDAPWDDSMKMFFAGKVAMYIGKGPDSKDQMEDRFGIVPLPLGEGMTEYANVVQSHNVRVMPSNLDPTLADQIAYVYTKLTAPVVDDPEESEALERQSLENRYWDNDSVEIYLMLEKGESKIFNHYESTDGFWEVVAKPLGTALRGENTVAAVIAAAQQAWEEDIAKTNAENAK